MLLSMSNALCKESVQGFYLGPVKAFPFILYRLVGFEGYNGDHLPNDTRNRNLFLRSSIEFQRSKGLKLSQQQSLVVMSSSVRIAIRELNKGQQGNSHGSCI